MTDQETNRTLQKVLDAIKLPEDVRKKAIDRFADIAKWLNRDESAIAKYDPFLYNQGSFRLGTIIRPVSREEECDLDISCKFQREVNRTNITQEKLRDSLLAELEAYCNARQIKHEVTEKKRCLRLEYEDRTRFHIDLVPCIPTSDKWPQYRFSGYVESYDVDLRGNERREFFEVFITDNTLPSYKVISLDWLRSNPEGLAQWFEQQSTEIGNKKGVVMNADAKFSEAKKSTLQNAVKLLKRHRDVHCTDDDLKPISIIITTLAAKAYNHSTDLIEAVLTILDRMPSMINEYRPYVPNPVNPSEDFADKWAKKPALRKAFEDWVEQATLDLCNLKRCKNANELEQQLQKCFGIKTADELADSILPKEPVDSSSKTYSVPTIAVTPTVRPWCR